MSKRFPALLFLLALGGSAVAPSVARADDSGVVSARPMRVHERRHARVQHRHVRRVHVARADVHVPPVCTTRASVARSTTVVTSNSPFVPGREVAFRQVTTSNPASSCSMPPAPVAAIRPPQPQPFPIQVTLYDSTSRFQPSRQVGAMPMPMRSASVDRTVQPMPSTSVYTEQQNRTPMPVDTRQDRYVRPGDRGAQDDDLVPAERVIVPDQDTEGVRPGDVGID